MTTLSSLERAQLIADVYAARRSSRVLDVRVAEALGYQCPVSGYTVPLLKSFSPLNDLEAIAMFGDNTRFVVPRYTESLSVVLDHVPDDLKPGVLTIAENYVSSAHRLHYPTFRSWDSKTDGDYVGAIVRAALVEVLRAAFLIQTETKR